MPRQDPAMPFYAGDWLASFRVQTMSVPEELCYFRLCLFCWISGDASIPDDMGKLSILGRADEETTRRVVEGCFKKHPTKKGFLTQAKVFELWSERQKWREKSRAGGVKSGQSRRSAAKGGSTTVAQMVEPNANTPSPSPSPRKPPPPTPSSAERDRSPAAAKEEEDFFSDNGRSWSDVQRLLAERNVGAAPTAVEAAKKAGLQLGHAYQLVEHFDSKPGAWNPGALYSRFVNATPGLAVAEGWPPMLPKTEDNARHEQLCDEWERRRAEEANEKPLTQEETDDFRAKIAAAKANIAANASKHKL